MFDEICLSYMELVEGKNYELMVNVTEKSSEVYHEPSITWS